MLFVIFKFPFHHQLYRGVFGLHWQLVQVVVGLVFLDGAADSALTTIRLRDREVDGKPCQDAMYLGSAVLGFSGCNPSSI